MKVSQIIWNKNITHTIVFYLKLKSFIKHYSSFSRSPSYSQKKKLHAQCSYFNQPFTKITKCTYKCQKKSTGNNSVNPKPCHGRLAPNSVSLWHLVAQCATTSVCVPHWDFFCTLFHLVYLSTVQIMVYRLSIYNDWH